MTPAELYRMEAERRGLRQPRPRLTLKELAERVGIDRRAPAYHIQRGSLRAVRAQATGAEWRWEVEADEADRWAREYTRYGRTTCPV